ncbi:helix-turn-helix domain-containing protein [Mycobacterium kansasii]
MSDTASETVPVLWSEKRTAEQLGVSPGSLRQDRHRGIGLPFVRLGRKVRYRAEDIAAYIAAHTVSPETVAAQRD